MLSGLKLLTVWETQKPCQYVPTGSKSLDLILGGGIRTMALTEVLGASGSGKTQLAIELMVNALVGDINGNVIYVSTKNCLTPENFNSKLIRYVNAFNYEEETKGGHSSKKELCTVQDMLKKVRFKRVFSLNELIFIVYHIREIVDKASLHNPIKLVIIDSFTHFLRDQVPLERLRISYELAGVLEDTAVKFNCAIVITTDMSANVQAENQSMSLKHMLGESFAHRPNQRIELQRNAIQESVTAFVWKNLNGKSGLASYKIDEEGEFIDLT